MTLKDKFKKSFSYTWYLYVLAIVVPSIAFPLSYSFMHRPQEYQKLSLFLSVNGQKDELSKDIENMFKDEGVKNVEIVSFDNADNEYMYLQKLNVVGINKCDVLIIPESMLNTLNPMGSMIEFNEDVKTKCNALDQDFFSYEDKDYGVKLTDSTPLKRYECIKSDEKYYAFLGGKSWNVGEYSSKTPNSSHAFDLMRFLIGKENE